MTPRTGIRRRNGRDGEHGQMIVLFALCLVAIIAVAGLLIDGGMAWSKRRQAQAAADTSALAAANAIVGGVDEKVAALAVAQANVGPDGTDCSGAPLSGNAGPGVQVNHPPLSGPHTVANDPLKANEYVEVITTRKMTTTFSGVLGMSCWLVSARAVSTIGTSSVAQCSFCSLNNSYDNHTLELKNGSALRVDGDIFVNSRDGLTGDDKASFNGTTCVPDQEGGKAKNVGFYVCGDGFDIFGAGGYISAQSISVVGGWETHDKNIAYADHLAQVNGADCPLHTQPTGYATPPANVCIGMQPIADPYNDDAESGNKISPPTIGTAPVANANGCVAGAGGALQIPTGTSGAPVKMVISGSVARTICPGTYFGGISISGTATVTMLPGIYYIAGGGFAVSGGASLNGAAGVMIYNATGGSAAVVDSQGVDLVPDPNPLKKDAKKSELKADPDKNISINQAVDLRLKLEKDGHDPAMTGTVTFYDGPTEITGCVALPIQPVAGKANEFDAVCPTQWPTFGIKAVSAVYSGDAVYNPSGDAITLVIAVPANQQIAPVTIETTGVVKIHGPTSGPYKGMTIFQERSSNLTITLDPGFPGSGRPAWAQPACGANFMTVGVPDGDAPAACGALGGLQGTIYAAHPEAQVLVQASGLANLQLISGRMRIISDSDARFAYTPDFFANGRIRLIE